MSFSTSAVPSEAENPWISALPAPSKRDSRRGLLAPAPAAATRKKPRMFYAMIAVGAIVAIVCVQLALSITVSQRAFQLSSQQQEQVDLGRSLQASSEIVQKLSSPQNLAANANALGMVSNGNPVYLRLSNGKVVGSPTPAGAVVPPGATPGTVAATGGNRVPDALLQGVPLVTGTAGVDASATKAATPAKKPATGKPATPKTNAAKQPSGPVAWTGQLPAPDTH